MKPQPRLAALLAILCRFMHFANASVNGATCDPLHAACPPVPGLDSTSYGIDFTRQSTTPSDWVLADHATVTYGAPDGATFTFAKRYDAPYIWTNFYFLYGRVEVVLKAAPGSGIITGAVLMGDDGDEIDWEWSGNNFGNKTGKVQTNFFGKGITGNYGRGTEEIVDSPQTKFHTYAYDWTAEALSWSIDGKIVRTLRNNGTTTGDWQYPQTPARLHLGVWCAGDPDGYPGTVYWAGGYTKFEEAPFSAYVKSVKITTPKACKSWKYPTPFDGSWKSVECSNDAVILPCNYTVVAGDDGYKIAKSLKMNFETLKAANPGTNWDGLWIGQVVKVPGGTCPSSSTSTSQGTTSSPSTSATSSQSSTASNSTTSLSMTVSQNGTSALFPNSTTTSIASNPSASTYQVLAGDRFDIIAQKLGCSSADLHKANPNIDWNNLQIGQQINTPSISTFSNSSQTGNIQQNSTSFSPITNSSSLTNFTTHSMTTTTSPPVFPNTTASSNATHDSGIPLTFAYNSTSYSNSSKSNSSIWTNSTSSSNGNGQAATTSTSSGNNITTSATSNAQPISSPSTVPSTTSSSNSTNSSKSNAVQPTTPPNTTGKLTCNEDICLRNMLDPRFSTTNLAWSWCTGFMATPANTAPAPTYLDACEKNATRLSSACNCMMTNYADATGALTSTTSSGALSNQGHWILRWVRRIRRVLKI